MAGKKKPRPIDVFEDNIADAERLIALTGALLNTRERRMRAERRKSFGEILRIAARDRSKLDCVESGDVFVLLKPRGAVLREHFTEPQLRPLLRQAVVAISAAVESYVAEKACSFIGDAMKNPTERLRGMAVSFGDVLQIETQYKRRSWGYRDLIEEHLERESSPSPSKIGIVMSTVGKKGFWPAVDKHRGVARGLSERQLSELYERRNRIAHAADRAGYGRATLSIDQARAYHLNSKEIVEALEAVL
jgi:hypothetical protein